LEEKSRLDGALRAKGTRGIEVVGLWRGDPSISTNQRQSQNPFLSDENVSRGESL
jgi:hypothetical protein